MNSPDKTITPPMEETAALWAARLDSSTLNAESRQALDQWLESDPRHRALLSDYCQFSADLEGKLAVLHAVGGVDFPLKSPGQTQRHRGRWIAGVSFAAAAIAMIAWFTQPQTQFKSFATPAAQRQSLDLVDGSKVDLDARTSLRIEIDGASRRVRLAEGEAFFAVTKDPTRPFIVETPAGSVRVKGTKFDVRATSAKTLTVTVIEGVVQISPAGSGSGTAPVILDFGDQLTLGESGASVRKLNSHELDDAIAWREGQIVFNGVTLREALDRFGRHHGIGITATPEAARQRIGGRYSLDDLNGFFSALEEVVPVRVSRNLNGTVQVRMRHPGTEDPALQAVR